MLALLGVSHQLAAAASPTEFVAAAARLTSAAAPTPLFSTADAVRAVAHAVVAALQDPAQWQAMCTAGPLPGDPRVLTALVDPWPYVPGPGRLGAAVVEVAGLLVPMLDQSVLWTCAGLLAVEEVEVVLVMAAAGHSLEVLANGARVDGVAAAFVARLVAHFQVVLRHREHPAIAAIGRRLEASGAFAALADPWTDVLVGSAPHQLRVVYELVDHNYSVRVATLSESVAVAAGALAATARTSRGLLQIVDAATLAPASMSLEGVFLHAALVVMANLDRASTRVPDAVRAAVSLAHLPPVELLEVAYPAVYPQRNTSSAHEWGPVAAECLVSLAVRLSERETRTWGVDTARWALVAWTLLEHARCRRRSGRTVAADYTVVYAGAAPAGFALTVCRTAAWAVAHDVYVWLGTVGELVRELEADSQWRAAAEAPEVRGAWAELQDTVLLLAGT